MTAAPALRLTHPMEAGPGLAGVPSIEPKPVPTEEQIRERAYQLYVERGCTPGNPIVDWLDAESQLRYELSRASA
ncbi:MAG: DUF2934 domain-containing protein [Planctomycetota bacterium]|nr:MAG: DUF2934 domain-containing protein [Planctomycetota bacterium]